MYQNDGKCMEKDRSAHDPEHTTSSVKHVGSKAIVLEGTPANGTGSLVFINDVTADKSNRMNSRAMSSAHIQPNASGLIVRFFTVQMDTNLKLFEGNKREMFCKWASQSSDLNPAEPAFHWLKAKPKTKISQEHAGTHDSCSRGKAPGKKPSKLY